MKISLSSNKTILLNLLIKELTRNLDAKTKVFYIHRMPKQWLEDYFIHFSHLEVLNSTGFSLILQNYDILPVYVQRDLYRVVDSRLKTLANSKEQRENWSLSIYEIMGNNIEKSRTLIKQKLGL